MNCKPGDLAYITNGPSAGTIVQCVERYDGPWKDYVTGKIIPCGEIPGWRLDREVPHEIGKSSCFRADKWLRPIRDNDGEDEMLRIVGKPQEVTA